MMVLIRGILNSDFSLQTQRSATRKTCRAHEEPDHFSSDCGKGGWEYMICELRLTTAMGMLL